MEKLYNLDTKDGHIIYGTWNGSEEKSNKLVIFVHGLTGIQHDHLPFNCRKYLNKRNIDTFRFNLYDYREKGRQLKNTDFYTQVSDMELAVNFWKNKGYEKIYLVGHSLGGLMILSSKLTNVDSIVLWDPSEVGVCNKFGWGKYYKNLDCYINDNGVNALFPKSMIDQLNELPTSEDLAMKIKIPVKMINARKGVLTDACQKYAKNFTGKSDSIVLEEATHCFVEDAIDEELFYETYKWIEKY